MIAGGIWIVGATVAFPLILLSGAWLSWMPVALTATAFVFGCFFFISGHRDFSKIKSKRPKPLSQNKLFLLALFGGIFGLVGMYWNKRLGKERILKKDFYTVLGLYVTIIVFGIFLVVFMKEALEVWMVPTVGILMSVVPALYLYRWEKSKTRRKF